ncbi:MAG TPA: zeta toxin family protein [Candidatus Acidoferrales bacterium]|jgi:uridine kinase|nr:zeta toxin family protein [Candidatus Acidoferrales bacterium]
MDKQPKIIAIVGGSGSGKTWLATRLLQVFGSQAVHLSQDDFYHDLRHLPPSARAAVNFDHPHAIDWPEFERVLRNCRNGNATRMPWYDFATHTRLPEGKDLIPGPLILVEGLSLLWLPRIWELFDLKVFLGCTPQLRLERRLIRDVTERGRTPDSVREQFLKTVAPMHREFVAPQAKWADVILQQPPTETELRKLIKMIQAELPGTRDGESAKASAEEFCLQNT